MWTDSDGEDIKKILGRINKLKLSKMSEDLLLRVLFTNAYPPEKNLDYFHPHISPKTVNSQMRENTHK